MSIPTALVPQQGFKEVVRQPSKPVRKESAFSFETFLRNWADYIRREQEKTRKITEMSVTLHRRYRGLTLDDLCGRYGVRRETSGKWLDWDAELDGEIHPINIIQPAFRANTNACLQSNSATEIKSANASARNTQIALRWQRIADYWDRTSWSESEREFIFDAVQKDGTILLQVYKEKCSQKVSGIHEKPSSLAVFQCKCGKAGIKLIPEMEEKMTEIDCPECGNPAQAMVKKYAGFGAEESNLDTYDISHRLIPFFNYTIDAYGAKKKGIQSAKWLQIQELLDRPELESRYPHFSFGSSKDWSYQLRCDYALASNDWRFLNYVSQSDGYGSFDRFEQRGIYLHSEAYLNYVSPDKYEFTNSFGEQTFRIERGQTICEAQESLFGRSCNGFKFIWIDERLCDIVSPDEDELNFRECFSDVHWLRDSSSYLSSPNYSLAIIQDDITLLNTMNHNIIARNAVIPVYYDDQVFEQSDFSKEYISSTNAAMLPDRDITKSVFSLPIPTPSPYLSNQLQFLWEVKDSVSLVQPALKGEAQKGETFSAQRQQLEQSYGALTAVLKSWARCKDNLFIQKAKIAKESWTLEQFQKIASAFGEMWSDDDVQEMCQIDFDADLLISYRQGSEMPQSNFTKELKFMQGLQQVMGLLQAGFPLQPDKINKILQKVDEFAEFDFDLSNLETVEIISQKRVLDLMEICVQFKDVSQSEVDAYRGQIVSIDEQGQPITALDVAIENLFAQSNIRFSEYEDLSLQRPFFVEELQVEIGKSKPNYIFIEALTALIGMLDSAIEQLKAEEMSKDPAVQMQLAAAKEAEEKEGKTAEAERANQKEDQQAQFEQELVKSQIAHEQQKEMSDKQLEEQQLLKAQDAATQAQMGAE